MICECGEKYAPLADQAGISFSSQIPKDEVEIEGDVESSKRMLDNFKLCYIGPSLGGVETLITHPALVTYYDYTREERYRLGITDTLFRLAVGIEDVDDIIADLAQALEAAK